MGVYEARVVWNRGDQPFSDNKYGRGHDWRFDGGATVRGSSAPSAMIPPPLSVMSTMTAASEAVTKTPK